MSTKIRDYGGRSSEGASMNVTAVEKQPTRHEIDASCGG